MSKSSASSAVANGSRLLDGIDARSAPARRFRDLTVSLASDLGGIDNISEAQRQLVRSAAGLVVIRKYWNAKSLNGESWESISLFFNDFFD